MKHLLPASGRSLKIIYLLLKYNIDGVVRQFYQSPFLSLLSKLFFFRKPITKENRAQVVNEALEALGPIFIKMGQLLSTRLDILPPDFAISLTLLQDKVTPFATPLALAKIEQQLDKPIKTLFASFEETPLGSASIAQVHGARLHTGEEIVVKILRPNIHQAVAQDVRLLEMLAQLLLWLVPPSRRFKPKEVVKQIQHTLYEELDLRIEAGNAGQLKRNFEDSTLLYVPKIYWAYTTADILVVERIYGVPIRDIHTLKAQGTNLRCLAENGVEIFFTQVFRDSFFHADMHPGNVFVDISTPNTPKYMAVDFGIMGTLSSADQDYLALNFLAFFNRDYRKVAQLHVDSGWVPAGTRVEDFETAIRTVCEPIFGLPLKEISFGQTLLRLFQTAQRFQMPIQPQLILLQKTLLAIEGLGRELYPDLDLWQTAKPFLEKWLKQRVGVRATFKRTLKQNPFWLERMLALPEHLEHYLMQQKPIVHSHKKTPSRFWLGVGLGLITASLFWLI